MSSRDWKLSPEHPQETRLLSQSLGLSSFTAQVLIKRGYKTPEEASHFLFATLKDLPRPETIPGMAEGIARIRQALSSHETIFLFGDYDVDGITGTAILELFLKSQGGKVLSFLPNRFTDGYGLTLETIDKLSIHKKEAKALLITIDNGTKAVAAIAKAKAHGFEVIVLDHHETPETDPGAIALINPKKDLSKPLPLCSAGLAFYVVIALRASLRESGIYTGDGILDYLDFATLGTIADVVPLVGVNRILVKEGLKRLPDTRWVGLNALMTEAGLGGTSLSAGQVGFRLAPRLNASGRLDDAQISLRLLTESKPLEAMKLAQQLGLFNRQRQEEEEVILREAFALLDEKKETTRQGILLAKEGWHEGILGIIAARLTEKFQLPALVLTIKGNEVKGSGRSISGFDLHDCVKRSERYLKRWGGHQAAIGLSLDPADLEAFRLSFEEESARRLASLPKRPALTIDGLLPFEAITPAFLSELEHLSPFGCGNPEPTFATKAVTLKQARIVGKDHLKLVLADGTATLPGMYFRFGEKLPTRDCVSLAYMPEWNEWNGEKSIQLRIKDLAAG